MPEKKKMKGVGRCPNCRERHFYYGENPGGKKLCGDCVKAQTLEQDEEEAWCAVWEQFGLVFGA